MVPFRCLLEINLLFWWHRVSSVAPQLITGLSHLHSRGEYYHAPAPAGEACAFRAFGPILWVLTKLMMEL